MGALKEEYLPHYTYRDYCQWEGDWELIYGVAYAMSPSPTFQHQDINAKILFEFMQYLKNCKKCKVVAEVDWNISNDTVLRPDISVVCNMLNRGKFIHQTPNVIFGILSPSTKKQDRHLKYDIYEEYGVEYYIIVEPQKKEAEVYKLQDKTYKLEGIFTKEAYTFRLDECEIGISFANIFED